MVLSSLTERQSSEEAEPDGEVSLQPVFFETKSVVKSMGSALIWFLTNSCDKKKQIV